jgi:hypothetical protein
LTFLKTLAGQLAFAAVAGVIVAFPLVFGWMLIALFLLLSIGLFLAALFGEVPAPSALFDLSSHFSLPKWCPSERRKRIDLLVAQRELVLGIIRDN